jgi:anti-anti-sigma factor
MAGAAGGSIKPSARGAERTNPMTPDVGTAELTQVGGTWLLALAGEHDLSTVPMLEHRMQDVSASGTTVVIDLSDAAFIDCAIVGWLLRWSHAARESDHLHLAVVVGGDRAITKRVLDLVRVNGLVPSQASRDEAMKSLDGGS